MTHLTILALGSYGDVLPLVVLGQGLKTAGFAVRVITTQNFAALVTQYDLDFEPIPGDAELLMKSSSGVALAESGQNIWKMWRSLKASFWQLSNDISRVLSQAHLWQTDAIINQLPGGLYGSDLAEKLQIPLITVAVIPLQRTTAFPMMAFPAALAFLPGFNAISYRLAEQIVWSGFRQMINQWRRDVLGLVERPFFGNFYQIAQAPTLFGFSEAIVPRPADWGPNVHYTGYWRPKEPDWTPPASIIDFLAAGPPPIFVGFGSMPMRHPQRVKQIVLAALQHAGQRAVLQTGWAGIDERDLPDNIYLLDYAPYHWLFPQMAAVVHHGGSGTTGFGLWAGVPNILTPFLFDQFYWGQRIKSLGVGPAPIPFKKLTVTKLAAAIETAVSNQTMRQKATTLSQQIRQEDGVATAVELIRQIVFYQA